MKILHVVTSLEPGGMENGLVNVARALDPSQFEVHVACLERTGAFAERLPDPEKVTVLGKKSGFSQRAVFRLAGEISRIRPALIHSHNLGPLIYSSLATLGGTTCPILHGEHSSLTEEECSPKRLRQRRWLYHCCSSVHTVAHGLSRHLVELGFPPEKITTIVNGVDLHRFAPGDRSDARRQSGIPADAFVIGIVGRFGPFKRHALLLEAFARLGSDYPELHLLIVGGGGSEQSEISEKARTHPHATRIHLAGFQKNPVPFYQSMDLLAVPSVNEGLSNAVLEAMACGVPVLANSACGNGDVIVSGVDGMVADLGTSEKLREQLSLYLAKPEFLRAIGNRAAQKAVSAYSIDQMVAGYVELYRRTGNRKSR
ncbi:MAG: glycosyltransferase [Verrucomicrobiota bacterium]